ncbi:MAG: FAD-dependent oxidoreductase [Alteromonadaceae bacterium]|uniref:NAD(P)/FAD-dependent oxidoreductase n=1 Tax=Paraglaciecola chathamensis TaxID=368405 RepID=UPI000C3C9C6E|nr:FAD-binding oxidoreductase [Paraglaciecola agarilytica]MBN26415.1 FAD-dependent oxidoreductase [Alteromonadaceae bacterium]|tara:strand:+ start:52279 stop:53556 length:1278 start_codon:yes stop_codon:yes gene_type:complete
MKSASYWLDTAPVIATAESKLSSANVDVVVIGGGFTGLSSALALAQRGATVALCEAGIVGGEASGRNGGQCNNGTAQDYAGLIASYGEDKARAFYQFYNQAVDSVESLVRDEQIDCDFRRAGKIKLAAKPEHFEKLVKTHEALIKEVDTDAKLLDAAQLQREIVSDQFYGGLLTPNGAQLHVGKMVHGLATRCIEKGVAIFQHQPVIRVDKKGPQQWVVHTPEQTIVATSVLVATGGSGPGPFSWFRRRIVPVGSFAITTEPLNKQMCESLFPGNRSYVTSKNIGNYFRLTPDRRLLFGGRARFAVSNSRSDLKSGDILRQSLYDMFPQLANTRIDYCWGGTVDMSADRLPKVGEHNGMFYAMGYSGHGVQMALHMGKVMADLIDGKPTHCPWKTTNWPAVPFHFGKPWFLPLVGMYYKVQDKLH